MLTKKDKHRICDKALELNVQYQKGEISLKEQNDSYYKFIKELEEINAKSFGHEIELLHEAVHDLFIEFCKSLKIDKFSNWLDSKGIIINEKIKKIFRR